MTTRIDGEYGRIIQSNYQITCRTAMYIHIFDKQTRRHIRLDSPPVELFERCGTDGIVRLELHRLAKWARAIHRKNPQFDLSMILSGVAIG